MGKIVKYCNACDESFAEKFGFCPICGDPLNAFEMNPVKETAAEEKIEPVTASVQPAESHSNETFFTTEQVAIPETNAFQSDQSGMISPETPIELDLDENVENEPIAETFAGNGTGQFETEVVYDDFRPATRFSNTGEKDDFHVTVLTEKNVKQRNILLLGTMVIMVALSFGVVIASIFNHPLLVGAIGEDELGAFVPVIEEVPMTVEEEKQRDNDKDAGGGGGGGRDEKTPTSKGQLATQVENPLFSPSKTYVKKDFDLKYQAATQGKKEIEQTEDTYGDINSKYTSLSDGRGTGGGQGSGEGTGQGSGRGTGQGSGDGSGSGRGLGDGEGDGTGSGRNSSSQSQPKAPAPTGPSKKLNFISKPQPRYTDAARINNIQGQVTLRITFLANGQIGGISPVKGLPHGLTEQAIAAARQIRFEPELRNGQPQSVTRTVQYTFTIY